MRNQTSLIHHLESFGYKHQKPTAADLSKKRFYWKVGGGLQDLRKTENQAEQRDRQLQMAAEQYLIGWPARVPLLECMNRQTFCLLVTVSSNSKKGDLARVRSGHELTS